MSGDSKINVLVLSSDALFPHFFGESTLSRLSDVSHWTRYSSREDSEILRQQVSEADALMTTWHSPFLTREILGTRPRVKLIAHCGGEVKSRVAEEMFEQITVTNAADPMAAGVAEMALALMLTMVRRIPTYVDEMKSGVIRTNEEVGSGETLRGRKVGIVGFGRIGKALARLIEPFGVELLINDPHCDEGVAGKYRAQLVQLDHLIVSCSVVVLAAGLTPESKHLLNSKRLATMKDSSYLINVARGGLIDMEALLRELRSGRLNAALDVTDPVEPLPPEHELRQMPNVLLTPHIAAGGIEMRREMGALAVEEVVHFAKGEPPVNRVTREMLSTMT